MNTRINRATFEKEQAIKTLETGRIYASLLAVLLVPIIIFDRKIFGMDNTLACRLVGIIPPVIFVIGSFTFLKTKKRLIIPFYGSVIGGSVVMFCWLGYIVFTQHPSYFHISSFLFGIVMLMFISTWMALGFQRYFPVMVLGALLFLNYLLLVITPSIENMGTVFALNILGIFTMAFNYLQDKNEFERYRTRGLLIQKEKELSAQKERLEILNNDLKSFNYSISHDLKTPVRNVNSFTQLLLKKCEGSNDEEVKEYASYINSNARQMVELIDGLTMLSKIGKRELKKQRIDLELLAKQKFRDIMIARKADAPEPILKISPLPEIMGVKSLIGQVIANLLSNAIKYSAKTVSPVIELSSTEYPDFYVVRVRDNGIGFEEEYAEALFRPFKRLHSAAKYEGVGLGLSIVERIIRVHGGKVWAKPNDGEGASFFFSIPKSETAIVANETFEN